MWHGSVRVQDRDAQDCVMPWDQPDETFQVVLSERVGATITRGTATRTNADDDSRNHRGSIPQVRCPQPIVTLDLMAGERGGEAAVVVQRSPGWAFRILPGQVIMARPGGEVRTLAGWACVTWIALDVPGSSDEILQRIEDALPEMVVERRDVDEAIVALVDGGVLEQAS